MLRFGVGILTRAFLAIAPRRAIRAAFTRHYVRRDWDDPESVSGRGSSLLRTEAIRSELPALFQELRIRSVLDAGCGDFNWFSSLPLELESYVGIEVVEDLARLNNERFANGTRRFVSLDIAHDPLPRADLIFCRDVLVHLKNRHAVAALQNFRRSKSTYLLATTFTGNHPNDDVPLGGWRPLNLAQPPFNLGPPLRVISEAASVEEVSFRDKSLGLWRL
jgi:SAM-dependent methyltransferase